MILLKISNASELVASKIGGLAERLTPNAIDTSMVEELVVKKMIENLAKEGIKGEIATLHGVEVEGGTLLLNEGFRVRGKQSF